MAYTPKDIIRYGRNYGPAHILLGCNPRVLDSIPPDRVEEWTKYFLELWSIRRGEKGELNNYAGFAFHFKKLVTVVWGDPSWQHRFLWTPYACRMLDASIENRFVAIAGCASSGKSLFGVVWGLVNFLLDPENVKVFITSTTLEESRQRIWGVTERFWLHLCEFFGNIPQLVPGELVSSRGHIRSKVNGVPTQLAGLALLAGAKGHERESSTKIGFKALKVIMVGDEFASLSHELYDSIGNLFSNDFFQLIAMSNPRSHFDPFGVFAEPADGWNSVDEHTDRWKTKLGVCERFDGLKGPNILAGREVYPGLLTCERLQWYKETWGENTSEFWAHVRGYFSPTGRSNACYSEANFEEGHALRKVDTWISTPTPWASLDPSFAHGGDRAAATFGVCGEAKFPDGTIRKVCEKTKSIDYNLMVDKKLDKSNEIVRLFAADILQHSIQTKHIAIDATGADSFASLLAARIGAGFLVVKSNGRPSDLPVSKSDPRKCSDRYFSKASELWANPKELIRTEQIAGLDAQIMQELCARDYSVAGKGVIRIEEKSKMRTRTAGRSPDFADSWSLGVELCRNRLGLSSTERAAATVKKAMIPDRFSRLIRRKTSTRAVRNDLTYSGGAGW